MSTEPTGLENESCVSIIYNKQYLNFTLDRKVWCSYDGKDSCLVDDLTFNKNIVCFFCQYAKRLDIPQTLKLYKEKESLKRKGTLKCVE